MVKRQTAIKIRKAHRYLGLFLGIQFLIWTINGMYFSWTDIDEIHRDQYGAETVVSPSFDNLIAPPTISIPSKITSLELREIADKPYYWINDNILVDARNGSVKKEISKEEAVNVSKKNMLSGLKVKDIQRITEVGDHHEYRSGPLPAFVISYDSPENIRAYVSIKDGTFQTLRHRDWRWFDFLWMTHTMDYQGRDDFNTFVLRAFSLLGLITVLSGFTLWFTSSPSVRKIKKEYLLIITKIKNNEFRRKTQQYG